MATNVYDSFLEFIPVDDVINKYTEMMKHIQNYYNTRSDVLSTRNIGQRIVYGDRDANDFMNILGVTESDVRLWLNKSSIYSGFVNVNKPRQLLPCLVTMVLYKNKKRIEERYPELKSDDVTPPWKVVNVYFATIIVSAVQGKYFYYPPRQDIWDATLENLSGKYILKKVSNLMEFIEYYADLDAEKHNDSLLKGDDNGVMDYINSMYSYINSSIRNIRNEFDINYNRGNRVETETFYVEYEEGRPQINIQSSVSNDIEIAVRQIMNQFTQDPMIDRKLLTISCRNYNCSPTKIEPILGYIRFKEPNKYLYSLISNILKYYIATKKRSLSDIKSSDFIRQMSTAYQVSNTYDPFIIEIKNTLNEILKVYGEEFTAVGGRQTLQNSRIAIYTYFVLYVSKYK